MERILQIPGGTLNRNNGIATFLMNIYRNVNREKFQFDFIVFTDEKGEYDEEIIKLGGRLYHVERPGRNLIKNMIQTYKIMKQNSYHIMHRHAADALCWSDFYLAKKAGINHRIVHSHGIHTVKTKMHRFFYPLMIANITNRVACSKLSGLWLYHNNLDFYVIKNGIQTSRFLFTEKLRIEQRKELQISDNTLVLGNVGRLANPKNPLMTVKVFAALEKKYPNSKLIMLGEGDLRDKVEALVKQLNVQDKVFLPGVTSEVAKWMCAMDVGIYPSEFEGFPFSVIESEANGLPLIMSNRITNEIDVLGSIVSLSLDSPPDIWAEEILRLYQKDNALSRGEYAEIVFQAGYDIKNTVKDLENYYEKLLP